MDEKQTQRLSKKELELLRATFGKDDVALYALRDFLFQFTDVVPKHIHDVIAVLYKIILPELDKDIPINLQKDGFSHLNAISQVLPDVAYLHIEARDIVLEYLEQAMFLLDGGSIETIKLKDLREKGDKDSRQRLVDLLAYQYLTNAYLDNCLNEISMKANYKEETEEEKKAKIKKDSSK